MRRLKDNKLFVNHMCPYSQRVVIEQEELGLECELEEIDLGKKLRSFVDLARRAGVSASVPFLEIRHSNASVEWISKTTDICDHFAKQADDSLYPDDPDSKAFNIQLIEESITPLYYYAFLMISAKDETEYEEIKKSKADSKLAALESAFGEGPFFNGTKFSMTDIACAPLLRRFKCLSENYGIDVLGGYSKLQQYSEHLLERKSVKNGLLKVLNNENYDESVESQLRSKGSFMQLQNAGASMGAFRT